MPAPMPVKAAVFESCPVTVQVPVTPFVASATLATL
jgi:hypothetical protein